MTLEKHIEASLNKSIEAVSTLKQPAGLFFLKNVAELLSAGFKGGKKVLIAGNGGSLCDAMHFAEELTGFFRSDRPALPAIALADPGHITCVGNDVGFDQIFSRAIEALGAAGDIFIGLTTSGNSKNLIQAFAAAKTQNLHTVALLGRGGGALKGIADYELIVNGFVTSDRIQEAHMTALHILVELVEELLWGGQLEVQKIGILRTQVSE